MSVSSDNKLIAKNTLLLYARMILVLGVSLYTSRIVLATLGVVDYGLYNIVGSVVTMFVFLRSAMGNATNRYISFTLGKGDDQELKIVFSTSLIIHIALALLIVVLAETLGLWVFYKHLSIPPERMNAAFWAYQFSILTTAVGVMSVPYDADIIAHERMSAFAYISILDVTLKLIMVYLLTYISFDKLILYSFFLFGIQVINRIIYGVYCNRHFPESRFSLIIDKSLMKEMFSFASWNLIGNMAAIGSSQVLNIFLNMFFGPVVNAARGVANQVQGAVKGFILNFQYAVIPQITKTYATDNLNRMHMLIISSSKFSFFLFFVLALPIMLEAKFVLGIWLVEVPDHTVAFMRLILVIMFFESLEQPLHTANLATGKLKKFQTAKGLILMLMIPVSFIALKLGYAPESVFYIQLIVTMVSLYVQLLMIRPLIKLSLNRYFKEVVLRTFIVTVVSSFVPLMMHIKLPHNFSSFIFVCLVSVVSVLGTTYLLGLNSNERFMVNIKLKSFKYKIK